MKRSQPLKRTGFKPRIKPLSSVLRTVNLPEIAKPPMKRTRLKSKGPKMTAIRASAKGEDCTIRLPLGICNYDITTTVLCHENGAGAGMKSPDECGAYGCYSCHMVLDGHVPRPAGLTREKVLEHFERGNRITRSILKRKGLIK